MYAFCYVGGVPGTGIGPFECRYFYISDKEYLYERVL